ncbi:MAG: S46 family peptidase [Bacteroidia bacterium]|nr:S46 family peptidase [Bacteroidia bacterium]
MKKFFLALLASAILFSSSARADEGMWLPLLLKRLNEADMQKKGCKLTADEIYSVNHSSLKDAIVSLGGFCTAEAVSADGLLLTNHHCGFGAIQDHSSVDHDYITNGFWAYSRDQELSNEGLTAAFLIRIEDVTDSILKSVNDTMTETQRTAAITKASNEITTAAKKDNHYEATVKSFFNGNAYYLFVTEVFKDVRLVGAPPSAIGKFGGDTDNWMWPRHTGDFSILRVYCASDGKPAEYSKDNVPYHPKQYLPVSIAGYNKNDFAMVMGYPGRTDRFLTSWGVQLALSITSPTTVSIRDKKLSILKEDMSADAAVRIKYAAKYARSSNYWKYYIGQIKGLTRQKVYDKKKQGEADFTTWVNADDARKKLYGSSLGEIEQSYKDVRPYTLHRTYINEAMFQGPEILFLAFRFKALDELLKNKETKPEEISKTTKELKETVKEFFKDYNLPTDKKLFSALLKMFYDNVPKEQHPDVFQMVEKKFKGDFTKYAESVYEKTFFCSQEKLNKFLDEPKAKTLDKDPGYAAMSSIYNNYIEKYFPKVRAAEQKRTKAMRLYVDGLMKMQSDKKFYPDANSTMRLTYGQVLDYVPADAAYYNYFTTLKGVMEKEDSTDEEFIVPHHLKELYEKKDFGQYGQNGTLNVCFITNNDITGGNSGSPVMNAKGELIGLAFDGNWEAMSGDIAYDAELKRTINVDVRYVLFVIDKYAGAKNLISEMKIVK